MKFLTAGGPHIIRLTGMQATKQIAEFVDQYQKLNEEMGIKATATPTQEQMLEAIASFDAGKARAWWTLHTDEQLMTWLDASITLYDLLPVLVENLVDALHERGILPLE